MMVSVSARRRRCRVLVGLSLVAAVGACHSTALAGPGGLAFITSTRKKGASTETPCIDPLNPNCGGISTTQSNNPDQFPPGSIFLSFRASIRLRVAAIGPGAAPITNPTSRGSDPGAYIQRSRLNSEEAFGAQHPDGFTQWPDGPVRGQPVQPGSLTGMNWPFRDAMNFTYPATVPLLPLVPGGNDLSAGNGTFDSPTDLVNIKGEQNVPAYGRRPGPGYGIRSEIPLFNWEVVATDFTPRTLEVLFEGIEAKILTGDGRIVDVAFGSSMARVEVMPAPGAAGLMLAGGVVLSRRRRR